MSFVHKAYRFDWNAFSVELAPILGQALACGEPDLLIDFIDSNRATCCDPYEGEPLADDWRTTLETGSVQELADFALTRFYSPTSCQGLGELWMEFSETLPQEMQAALLGYPFGPEGKLFDPGYQGSYFQTPEQVRQSASALAGQSDSSIKKVHALFTEAMQQGLGIYVTF